MVRLLLENGANPKIKDKTGRNALEIAQLLKKDAIVKILQEFDNKDEFLKPNLEVPKSPFKFVETVVENNYSDEAIQCRDGCVHPCSPIGTSFVSGIEKAAWSLALQQGKTVLFIP
jgi:hypothetical protein